MILQEQKLREAEAYFKENDGFIRFFEKAKKKLESYEKEATGVVIIENPSIIERDALSGFMKKNYKNSKTISIRLGNFQKRLDETCFDGVKLKDLVQAYFNMEILTKKNKKELQDKKVQDFFDGILYELNGKRSYRILDDIVKENKEEFSTLKTWYNEDIKFERALKNACIAIDNLPSEKILIPVFSASILKNPHELDRNTLTGKIFILMVSKEEKRKKPQNTESLAEMYFRNNLLIDDLSNMVLCKNIIGMIGDKVHLGWNGFFESNEAMQVTLAQLGKITSVKTFRKSAMVFENPAVFSAVAMMDTKVPLICTYGQIKLSGIVLLNLLIENNVKVYYSGDVDPEGIIIADSLKRRYKENIQLVGFDKETYLRNLSKVGLSKQRIKKLEKVSSKELIEVAEAVRFFQFAAYEEKNLEEIIEFVKKL